MGGHWGLGIGDIRDGLMDCLRMISWVRILCADVLLASGFMSSYWVCGG